MLHKFPAHLHALDIKDALTQSNPGIEKLGGMKTSKLADKYIGKRNKLRNQCTLLRSQGEEGKLLYLDKVEEADELEQWRDNSNTDDTLISLTLIETFLDEIWVMDFAILVEEEEAATEIPSILTLLIKTIRISGNNPQIRLWWYEVMSK